MSNMARLIREEARRVMRGIRQAFRGTAARNAHGALIGIEMEGLSGESVSGELMQHYGFTSGPLPGAEFIALPVGGDSNHTVVIASEDGRYRIKVDDGEVALYTDEGDYVHMKRGRVVEVVTDDLVFKVKNKVRFDTPLVEVSGDLHVESGIKADGEITDHTRSMQDDRDIYNEHGHPSGNPPKPLQ